MDSDAKVNEQGNLEQGVYGAGVGNKLKNHIVLGIARAKGRILIKTVIKTAKSVERSAKGELRRNKRLMLSKS